MAWTKVGLAGVTAFVLSVMLTPLAIRIAHQVGLVSCSKIDRWHQRPTALLGGAAIFSGFMTAALLFIPKDTQMLSVLVGAVLVFALGILDDFHPLPAQIKLIGQVLAACIPVFNAVIFTLPGNTLLSSLITVLWIVGITNAINLLDNMDGLAGGTATISAGFLFGFAVQNQVPTSALMAVCLGGAVLGFLPYNFHPARIFMGDAGSLVLGYVLATATVLGSGFEYLSWTLLAPIALLGVPIFDTCFVTVMRILHKRQITQGGKDHTSHRLVALGLSEWAAVLLLYGINALLASSTLLVRNLSGVSSLVLTCITLGFLVSFGWLLAQVKVYSSDE